MSKSTRVANNNRKFLDVVDTKQAVDLVEEDHPEIELPPAGVDVAVDVDEDVLHNRSRPVEPATKTKQLPRTSSQPLLPHQKKHL